MNQILLHCCCAPCSLSCIDPLREEGLEPVAFWYNPNIHPWKEYQARRDCLLEYAPTIGMEIRVLEEKGYRMTPFGREQMVFLSHSSLDKPEIEEIIPHRHPFLLVDYIEDYEPGEFAVGYKCVTFREDFFRGHFPKEPVMPGVLMVEALAQVGAVAILSLEDMKGKTAYFGGINKCKFRRKVVPGDKLRLETKIIRRKGPVGIGSAVASVDGEVAVEAELTFMIG